MAETAPHSVIIYSTDWCGFCRSLKQYLDQKGVTYTEKNIEADLSAHAELMQKIGGEFRGVPVTDIDGQMILGFDRPRIDAALAT